MELLDECIRVWSAGKETNIKLLLSELHQVRTFVLDYIHKETIVVNTFILWPS